MEKYGFVYIWYDRKHKMFYIGSHWGNIDDGYICSSNRMRNAYRRRPDDFKRRILQKVLDRDHLLKEEEKWLLKVKNKKRYYNLVYTTKAPWWASETTRILVGQKISISQKSNPNFGSWNKGKSLSEETKQKISQSTSKAMKTFYKNNPRSEETCKKISENSKKLQAEGKIGMKGKKHKADTKQKMIKNNAMNNPEHVMKVKQSKRGIRWLVKDGIKKMAVPETDKYIELIQQGFSLITKEQTDFR